uniref:Uncharacterized protein n=1 Tax=Rangifer tarandus platyrhynchus TaxID=3082113 RepID=A0ACB0DTR8_RANTA|nr:unnamed protein product [Rangifer tarandus platyrhynchus]
MISAHFSPSHGYPQASHPLHCYPGHFPKSDLAFSEMPTDLRPRVPLQWFLTWDTEFGDAAPVFSTPEVRLSRHEMMMNLSKIFFRGEEEPLWDLELDLDFDLRDLERSLELERELEREGEGERDEDHESADRDFD